MSDRMSAAHDVVTAVRDQLPRLLRDRLAFEIRSDPFRIHVQVRLLLDDRYQTGPHRKGPWVCMLEEPFKVPDLVVAQIVLECL